MSFNFARILRESAKAHPDKPLLHLGDLSFSYAQVDELAGRVAGGLRAPKGAQLTHFQLPELPKGATGKILKRDLRSDQ